MPSKKISKTCENCNNEYLGLPNSRFCSRKCSKPKGINNPKFSKVTVMCEHCKNNFLKNKCHVDRTKQNFCSTSCRANYRKGKRQKTTKIITKKCSNCNTKIERTESEFNHKTPKHNFFCSTTCRDIAKKTFLSGEQHPNYNPNITDEERLNKRKTTKNKLWTISILKRDNYTCQVCKDNSGGNLNAHHLENYSSSKEKRFNMNNGITLCKKCHKLFHDTFGYRNNTLLQFNEFKKSYKIQY